MEKIKNYKEFEKYLAQKFSNSSKPPRFDVNIPKSAKVSDERFSAWRPQK